MWTNLRQSLIWVFDNYSRDGLRSKGVWTKEEVHVSLETWWYSDGILRCWIQTRPLAGLEPRDHQLPPPLQATPKFATANFRENLKDQNSLRWASLEFYGCTPGQHKRLGSSQHSRRCVWHLPAQSLRLAHRLKGSESDCPPRCLDHSDGHGLFSARHRLSLPGEVGQ